MTLTVVVFAPEPRVADDAADEAADETDDCELAAVLANLARLSSAVGRRPVMRFQ